MKKALVTGITGQDGSYLAELLLEKGYEVHGIIRRASSFNTARIEHLYTDQHDAGDGPKLILHYGDLADGQGLVDLMLAVEPDEVYNLGAQSHVRVSFDSPIYTHDVVAGGALRVLEAARRLADKKPVKVYQASSSEMFGKVHETPQKETTPFYPRSPYACAKVAAFHHTVNYRDSYGLFAVNGILFNHESPRRGETFVTRKITRGATRIAEGLQKKLYMGNCDSKRDWGYAKEYVEGMWRMLQADDAGRLTSSPPASPRRSSTSWSCPSGRSGWTGRSTSRPTPATSAPPRSTCCWATRPKRRPNWAGRPKPT